jgi:hypothetical protein
MVDKDENVISIDFGAAREVTKPDVTREVFERVAKERGYSPHRADELAKLLYDATARMFAYHARLENLTLTLPDDVRELEVAVQAFANDIAKRVGEQVLNHCAKDLALAIFDAAYPVER